MYSIPFDVPEKVHVGITLGTDLDTSEEGFVPFPFANLLENIRVEVERQEMFLANRFNITAS